MCCGPLINLFQNHIGNVSTNPLLPKLLTQGEAASRTKSLALFDPIVRKSEIIKQIESFQISDHIIDVILLVRLTAQVRSHLMFAPWPQTHQIQRILPGLVHQLFLLQKFNIFYRELLPNLKSGGNGHRQAEGKLPIQENADAFLILLLHRHVTNNCHR